MKAGLLLLCVGLATAASVGCLEPTQITLNITTNAACSDVKGTAITAGDPGALEHSPESTSTPNCDPDFDVTLPGGEVGKLVVVPSDSKDAAVGIKVAMGVGGDVSSCVTAPYAPHCIIARRSLSFVPHRPLTLPIAMHLNCLGRFCDELTTCVDGTCVEAEVESFLCVGSQGCPFGGTGGGGGGGPTDCLSAANGPPVAVASASGPQTRVAIAGDPSTCRWGVAWTEASSGNACFGVLNVDGSILGQRVACQPLDDGIDDIAVEALGGGVFVVGAWSSGSQNARLWLGQAGSLGPEGPTVHPAFSGALAASGDMVVMANEEADLAVVYRVYRWSPLGLTLSSTATIGGATGRQPDVAFSGGDLALSWQFGASGFVTRFDLADGPPSAVGAAALDCRTEVVVANHEPSNVVGVNCFDSGGASALATYSSTGFTPGGSAVSPSDAATDIDVVGTDSGWVVSWLDEAIGRLTNYDTEPQYILQDRQVAPDAAHLAIAAMGDQLGVIWIDVVTNEIYVRPVNANLEEL